ncbi:MAG: tRNA (adenosine(37)-N6)-threonylcarbamoyltransferase complex dimerization subunit type 1 TsaB [Bacteroidales bacterium]|nr:tRNA (adenosine(37)-N6)-threonylcarbamoyltransferase complex dimerization subunit type 1 TsaB [Bacteroidales bacterium]
MAKILLIETSTALTSVAIADGGRIAFYKDDGASRNQSALTAPFIKEALDSQGLTAKELDAVCVSMGPGSYTGLRVGVSSAKGLCFGAGVPLIAIGTLDCLVWEAIDGGCGSSIAGVANGCKYIVPMIDARRMEVYTAVFDASGNRITDIAPRIIDEGSFADIIADAAGSGQGVLFIGDAAEKCSKVISAPGARFVQHSPTARGLMAPSAKKFEAGDFENVAYFEPFYLKDFVATVSRKKLF